MLSFGGAESCRSLYEGLRFAWTCDGAGMASDPFFYHKEVTGSLYNDDNSLANSPLSVRFTPAQLAEFDRDSVPVATMRARSIEHLLNHTRSHYVGQRELIAYEALCGDSDDGTIRPEHASTLGRHTHLGDYTSVLMITHIEVASAFRGVGLGAYVTASAVVNIARANDLVVVVGSAKGHGTMRLHESCPFLVPLAADHSVLAFEMSKAFKAEMAALA